MPFCAHSATLDSNVGVRGRSKGGESEMNAGDRRASSSAHLHQMLNRASATSATSAASAASRPKAQSSSSSPSQPNPLPPPPSSPQPTTPPPSSLFCLSSTNPFRQFCYSIVHWRHFDTVVIAFIVCSSISLALEVKIEKRSAEMWLTK